MSAEKELAIFSGLSRAVSEAKIAQDQKRLNRLSVCSTVQNLSLFSHRL
jgi:hypothetical protein